MHINNLIIEVTRKCQFSCGHCLRGLKQEIDIKNKYIENLLSHVDSISIVTFTGGEPFLNISAIEFFIEYVVEHSISVDSFYIATNGIIFEKYTEQSIRCLGSLLRLYQIMTDPDMCSVEISVDQFHKEFVDISENNLLAGLTFFSLRNRGKDIHWDYLIPEGNWEGNTSKRSKPNNIISSNYNDVEFYLNAKGKIVWNCDLSYTSQDKCSISIKKALKQYNTLCEESVCD